MKDRTNSWKTHLEARIGGAWYSIPALGKCPASAPLGAGGCSWRLLERPLAFNASCVHGRLRAAVEAFGGGGFAARCSVAERRDVGSDCYTEALFDTILGNGTGRPAMPLARLVSVWQSAFAAGGCPPEPAPPQPTAALRGAAAASIAVTYPHVNVAPSASTVERFAASQLRDCTPLHAPTLCPLFHSV